MTPGSKEKGRESTVARGTPKDDENQKDMKEDQPEGEEANFFTHWPSRAKTLNFTFTSENPPKRWGWTTVERDTSSRLPDQKKEKTKRESSFSTQAGTCT